MSEQPNQLYLIHKENYNSVNPETLALLRILELGSKQIEANKVQYPKDILKRIRENGSITC